MIEYSARGVAENLIKRLAKDIFSFAKIRLRNDSVFI
jgi:hypothetical protein